MAKLLMALESTDAPLLKELLNDASNLSVDEVLLLQGFRCAPHELACRIVFLRGLKRADTDVAFLAFKDHFGGIDQCAALPFLGNSRIAGYGL